MIWWVGDVFVWFFCDEREVAVESGNGFYWYMTAHKTHLKTGHMKSLHIYLLKITIILSVKVFSIFIALKWITTMCLCSRFCTRVLEVESTDPFLQTRTSGSPVQDPIHYLLLPLSQIWTHPDLFTYDLWPNPSPVVKHNCYKHSNSHETRHGLLVLLFWW